MAELYAGVRLAGGGEDAWHAWRTGRDELFARHPDSPRPGSPPLPYAPHDPTLRFEVEVDRATDEATAVERSDGDTVPFRRFGRVSLPIGELDVYWLATYGGGVFLPFRDATNGDSTYGGGRYLLDTVKGADLGGDGERTLVLDFNFAYHPSCFYDPDTWACPLAPPANRLEVRVEAGELAT